MESGRFWKFWKSILPFAFSGYLRTHGTSAPLWLFALESSLTDHTTKMLLPPGTRFGHYEITSHLGSGGMGHVYKARDPLLARFVAIKTLLPASLSDPERKRRFAQEARAASMLSHPGIATIYEFGSENGMDFIPMEFVDGHSLESLIPRNGLSLREMLTYCLQTADAVAKAHTAVVFHSDLKPGNVMVAKDQRVKVLDFGLAKLVEESSPDGEGSTASVAPTRKGLVIRTASYMSPEQAGGGVVDGRSDIFSFGALMYEMLIGRRAFHGETPMATIGCVPPGTRG